VRIAINGAGIAGPTLAHWLSRSGHEVLLVERAPAPRSGGYAIDFWGIGYDVAERMGLLPRVLELGYRVSEMRYVDERGRKRGGFPLELFWRATGGRFRELARSDLARAIHEALGDGVETVFGDSVAAIEQSGECVRLELEHRAPCEVDLLIGADGLHSRVRRLAFGPEEDYEVPLGYHVAAFELAGYRPYEELVAVSHAAAGRQITRVSLPGDRTLLLFVFRDEHLSDAPLASEEERRAALVSAFEGVGWECPQILGALERVDDLYFDRVSQIRMERWTKGRVALIGDAAACVSLLAGEGTGLAMAEAYVLAGELDRAGGDHARAFARYQELLGPFLAKKQAGARRLASSFAPRTSLGVALRDRATTLLSIPLVARSLLARALRDDLELPRYELR